MEPTPVSSPQTPVAADKQAMEAPRSVVVPALLPDAEYDAEVPLADREQKWGFTLDELRAASKVVRTLFLDPSLFIGDPYLSDSRLYTMITRDRVKKRENQEVYRAIMNEEKSRRKKFQRRQNLAAVRLTIMKREREDALNTLLLQDGSPNGSPLLLTEAKERNARVSEAAEEEEEEEEGCNATTSAADDTKEADRDDGLSAIEKSTLRYMGVFENLLRLERCLAGREHFESMHSFTTPELVPPRTATTTVTTNVSGKKGNDKAPAFEGPRLVTGKTLIQPSHGPVDWTAASQLTAQVYRYAPHSFDSQMPPPFFPGPVPSGATEAERLTYIRGYKLHVARQVAALLPITTTTHASNGVAEAKRSKFEAREGDSLVHAVQEAGEGEELVVAAAPATTVVVGEESVNAFTSVLALRALIAGDTSHDSGVPSLFAQSTVTTTKTTTAALLDAIDTVLVKGYGIEKSFWAAPGCCDPAATAAIAMEAAAEHTLNLFLARRLYQSAKLRGYGESPIVVDRLPPASESEEPDEWSIFDELQLYATEHHDGDGLKLTNWRGCNICKVRSDRLHPYYYSMCHLCGEFNYNKRLLTRDLRGKVVLLTGCRIKIGFAMALSMLRCGAVVLGTTRFAHEAVARFQQEPDYDAWKDRLHLYSLDLRDLWVVTQFCAFVRQRFPKLFAIVNNAAQTIARTPQYTEHLRRIEIDPAPALRRAIQHDGTAGEWHQFFLRHTTVTVGQPLSIEHPPASQPFLPASGEEEEEGKTCRVDRVPSDEEEEKGEDEKMALPDTHVQPTPTSSSATTTTPLPSGIVEKEKRTSTAGAGTVTVSSEEGTTLVFDRYDTQAEESDSRVTNSWVMNLSEVQGSEAAEVMAINALAPFILNSKLKPCLTNREGDAVPNEARFIINVSAMEGQFYRFKQTTHPHTNMAKAALNMMTRTSADDYAQDGIYMNSVDTGWITDESPKMKKDRRSEQFLLCPLDEVDAAARCLDLMYVDSPIHGHFYKDFKSIQW